MDSRGRKTVLVTGAAGFIGFHVALRLLSKGEQVIGLDNLNSYYNVELKKDRLQILNEYSDFCFVCGDIENRLAIDSLFQSYAITHVVHLAAQAGVRYSISNPMAYVHTNLVGFSHVLEACRQFKVKHLLYASSSSVYGANRSLPFSVMDNVDHPVSLYAATKKSNELMAHAYSHLFGIPTTGLRFFTVYGPWGRPDMAIFLFTKSIMDGSPIKVFNFGDMARDFTYVDDVVEAVTRLVDLVPGPGLRWYSSMPKPSESSAPYRVYNIGNNSPVKLADLIGVIEDKVGKKAQKEYLPIQAGDVPETYADIEGIKQDIDFQPQTNIEDGVERFVEWYKTYYGRGING